MFATKEVRFDIYCPICQHGKKREDEDPCYDCLENGFNYDSHKPVKFEPIEEANTKPAN